MNSIADISRKNNVTFINRSIDWIVGEKQFSINNEDNRAFSLDIALTNFFFWQLGAFLLANVNVAFVLKYVQSSVTVC